MSDQVVNGQSPQPRVLELRVHGVSNTPPGELLGLPQRAPHRPAHEPRLVAGDTTTGFYRDPDQRDTDPVLVEAYSWGQLTSGLRTRGARVGKDIQRSLWTLLLPFSLANIALHARTEIPPDPGRERWYSRAGTAGTIVRLLCLSLTATLALAATGVGVDLFGWQCVGTTCLDRLPGSWELLNGPWWSRPGRSLALGLLLPVLSILVLWRLARRSYRYEAVLPADLDPAPAVAAANPLQHPAYWRGAGQVRRLGAVHVATGLAVSAAVPLGVVTYLHPPRGVWAVVAATAGAALAGAVLLSVPALAHPYLTRRTGHAPLGWYGATVAALAGIGLAGTFAHLLYGNLAADFSAHRPPWNCAEEPGLPGCVDRSLPGFDAVLTWLSVGQVLLLLALAGVSRTGRRALLPPALAAAALGYGYGVSDQWRDRPDLPTWERMLPALLIVAVAALLTMALPRSRSLRAQQVPDRHARVAWGGRGPAVLASLGWVLGLAYSAGLLYGATNLLNGDATPTGLSAITPPAPLMFGGIGLLFALALLLVTAIVAGRRWRHHQRTSLAEIRRDAHFVGAGRVLSAHEEHRARDVADAYGLHRLVERDGIRLVGVLAAIGAAVTTLCVAAAVSGVSPVRQVPDSDWDFIVKGLFDAGGFLAGLLPVLIAVLGLLVYRRTAVSRAVGIVWDIATFWPRSAHPLAPPCYAEMAVPQLQTRVAGLLHLPQQHPQRVAGVILGGHSQGAVLCVAALLQLPGPVRGRIWLLTFGCQLNRLYGRIFPAYLGPAKLAPVTAALTDDRAEGPRWTDFWRETDPLGYPVHAGNAEIRLDDPEALAPIGGEINDPPVRGHGNYPADPRYTAERDRAGAELLR